MISQPAQPAFAHVTNSFSFVVHASYQDTAPLFGPNGERAWGHGDWDPNFFYPQPAQDVPGAVFSIQHGPKKVIWVNTVFDLEARHFQYVYFMPDLFVTTIDVNFHPVDAHSTKVTVTYKRTAVDAAANEHVKHLGENDSKMGPQWEQDVNEYLLKSRR